MSKKELDLDQKAILLGQVFSPAAPIHERDVFTGRKEQVRSVIDAINQRGQHVLIYGERGVGKTSLANVLAGFLAYAGQNKVIAPHINCDAADDYSSIWRKIFRPIYTTTDRKTFGFHTYSDRFVTPLLDGLPEKIGPEEVVSTASDLAAEGLFIPIIDEFDRIMKPECARPFTDTIKALSDQAGKVTLVLVGVGGTVEELISEHHSVERALVQVRMPRMSAAELEEILNKGVRSVNMSIDSDSRQAIAMLSQGLPHYAHLLGLHSGRQALDSGRSQITVKDVDQAVRKAIDNSQQTLVAAYHKATASPRTENLYAQVLLACALAKADQLGYFAAADLRESLSRIMKKRYEIAAFSRHLADFCDEDRGPVLERIGVPRRFRFRFKNPLLQPFIIMQGLASQLISRSDLHSPSSQ